MNRVRYYFTRFPLAFALLLLVYGICSWLGFLQIRSKDAMIVVCLITLIFFIGTMAIYPGLKRAPEHMPAHFLAMTTLQIISFLAAEGAFFVTRGIQAKAMAFHFFALFLAALIFQSLFLVRTQREDS
jgi:hypothetical protein